MKPLRQILLQFAGRAKGLEPWPEVGLSSAQVAESRAAYGANTLTPIPREPLWSRFLGKFDEPIIRILLGAALLSTVVDLFKGGADGGFRWPGLVGMVLLAGTLGAGLGVRRLRAWLPSLMLLASMALFGLSVAVQHPSFEGLAVMLAVILATGVSFISEYRSDREFEALNSQKDSLRVKVNRDGAFLTIPMEEVVTGDLVLLEAGDEIPADGWLIRAVELRVDQSLLTGESAPVKKGIARVDEETHGIDRAGCAYRGTQVLAGVATLRVAEVGDTTLVGLIARNLGLQDGQERGESDTSQALQGDRVRDKLTISKRQTPLQVKLGRLADLISLAGYIAAVAILVVVLARAWIDGEFSTGYLNAFGAILNAVVYAVIIVVVAVPEGLPMSVTVSLALAMRKMTRANSLVRQLVACETIGSATVICSDKTGTLTENRMTVVRVNTAGRALEPGMPDWQGLNAARLMTDASQVRHRDFTPLDWLGLVTGVNSTAQLERKNGRLAVVGSGTEGALLHWLQDQGADYGAVRKAYPLICQAHFTSERKLMSSVIRLGGVVVVLVKGASETVLARSTHAIQADGSIRLLEEEERLAWSGVISTAAGEAMRTLAFACKILPGAGDSLLADVDSLMASTPELESGLAFAGLLSIRDPLRQDARESIDACRTAGIGVKMVTGDSPWTARAIGRQLGMLDDPNALLVTSDEFKVMSDAQALELLPRLAILARAQPLDKYRLVRLLQERGEVVAVTGDGTNDAPALKKADVGLSMGVAGTEVAKEASHIVLLDDAFSTIVSAVHWGRALYENIQRFIQFQLTINVSALVIAFMGPFLGIRPPFTVLQLLWVNVIMDTFAAIALCSEPPGRGLMQDKPKRRDEPIVTPGMAVNILGTALFFIVVLTGLLLLMRGDPSSPGWFAGDGPWMAESAGKLFPVLPGDLVADAAGSWTATSGAVVESVKLHFTMRQATIFFTAYVLFQVWNLINCRSLNPAVSGLTGLGGNWWFIGIAVAIMIGQVMIVNLGGVVFNTVPLGVEWAWIVLGTSSVLFFAEGVRRLRMRGIRQ